ncbi:hypothetical protein NE235_29400 [Actinoallomurus spadix]|uniref:Lipoprotein n=1 Tax=Actinoallomurus spadix TaxID=79912 RepID=A0ABP3HHT8_9ACTN|nr:hypothetical protein [Actinoallomurus spadix]MCO5990237.1 hypothetical protein [Actinoallomurus spadix]
MFRPLIPLAVLACAGGLAACESQDEPKPQSAPSSVPAASTPAVSAAPGTSSAAPASTPPAPCASAADFLKARAAEGSMEFRVSGRVICDHGWAAAYLKQPAGLTDPAWTVLRNTGGRWHLVTYGTDGLCGAPGMKAAPAKIKKALGPYC